MSAPEPDPIDAAWCVAGRDLTEPRLAPDGSCVGYVVSGGGGPAALIRQPLPITDGPARQLSAYPAPRPGRGMGGGCWAWSPDGKAIVYAAVDGQLWWQPLDGPGLRRLTAHESGVANSPSFSPDGTRIVYAVDDAEVRWVSVDGRDRGRLDDGSADFCLDPQATADGALWQAWSVPDMPWDNSCLAGATWDSTALSAQRVAGAIQQPRLVEGSLWWVSDETGWLNVHRDGTSVVSEPFEHAGPTWGPGQRSYAVSPDGRRVAFTRNEAGFGRLCVAMVDGGSSPVTVGRGVHGALSWVGNRLCAIRSGARTPTEIVIYESASDGAEWMRTSIAVGPIDAWSNTALTEPELVEIAGPAGIVRARLYRGASTADRLLCWIHGGPTDQWPVSFMPRIAYWQSRGWNVVVPDPRGTTGHGRAFQQALHGGWGVADVDDVVAVLHHAAGAGWAAPERTILCGGSSGGYAVLQTLGRADVVVAAGMVSYPVTDLVDLVERSHRFERHYTDTLVGPLPDARRELEARSPVRHPQRLVATPLLVLHGESDPVVPVEQSTGLAAAISAAGGEVTIHIYPGEGHGFRDPANKLDEYRRMSAFAEAHVPASVTPARRHG